MKGTELMTKKYCLCGCGKEIRPVSTWASGHNPNKTKDRFDWSNIVSDYKELGSLKAVAEKYNCTLQAVYYQLEKRGVNTSLKKIDTSKMLEDYKELKSICKVADKYECSTTVVRDYLKSIEGFSFNHDNKSLDMEIGIGRYGEKIALGALKGSKDMNEKKINALYDIEWRGLKIDVKVSRERKRKYGKGHYSFSTKNQHCDYYLIMALDENNDVLKILFVPRESVTGASISFGIYKENKWFQYETTFEELNGK